jgi:hypothetical protein
MDYRIIECLFSIIGVILSSILIWGWTYDMRDKFKVKYLLRPKFKKGDYVLVPDRNNKPTLAQIEYVSTDYKEKEISYGVRPTHFGNDYVDFEYYEQLNFDEECVYEVWEYCNIEMWDREINDIGGK